MFDKFWGSKNIFTNKALGKIKEQKISPNRVKNIVNGDYNRSESLGNGVKKYIKKVDDKWVGVIAKKDSKGTKILSTWKQSYPK